MVPGKILFSMFPMFPGIPNFIDTRCDQNQLRQEIILRSIQIEQVT
jgi:hypothetical protein